MEETVSITRRHVLAGAIAAPAVVSFSRLGSAADKKLKISHQFPGGTIDSGDFAPILDKARGTLDLEPRKSGQ